MLLCLPTPANADWQARQAEAGRAKQPPRRGAREKLLPCPASPRYRLASLTLRIGGGGSEGSQRLGVGRAGVRWLE
ncbi:hypothetical protein PHLCEN_2v9501 [Hermanssonia centrifuga]|uniref:Uncharacterized protein n=1 Tax=Hermanssonia centrifuga TaxID=98765 RepID=A0A2R6NQL4_9APHY|nr:hypothetical protein PHLCEN_2v9501 [Hermanssonia centrifuga]